MRMIFFKFRVFLRNSQLYWTKFRNPSIVRGSFGCWSIFPDFNHLFFLTASTSHFVTLLYDLDDESILLPEDVSFVSSIELGTGNHGRESPAIPKVRFINYVSKFPKGHLFGMYCLFDLGFLSLLLNLALATTVGSLPPFPKGQS